ncbi:MAG: response regulator transcription factor [Pseudomonadota bacterium]
MKILLIEDDQETAGYIIRGLKEQGHLVDHASDGHNGLMLASDSSYDVLIIDRMLPKIDGLTLLNMLRQTGITTSALFLTAMGSIDNRVQGLEAGADDYLIKPFAFAELNARINALARRPPLEQQISIYTVADLEMNLIKHTVTRARKIIHLQPTEFRLLEFLLRHANTVVTRTMLLEQVWGFYFDPKSSVVETHISRLRNKIDRGFDQEIIQTIRGAGYRIDTP